MMTKETEQQHEEIVRLLRRVVSAAIAVRLAERTGKVVDEYDVLDQADEVLAEIQSTVYARMEIGVDFCRILPIHFALMRRVGRWVDEYLVDYPDVIPASEIIRGDPSDDR